jgi:hypothetical protein
MLAECGNEKARTAPGRAGFFFAAVFEFGVECGRFCFFCFSWRSTVSADGTKPKTRRETKAAKQSTAALHTKPQTAQTKAEKPSVRNGQ